MTEKRFKEIYPDIIRSNYCFTDNGKPIGDKEVCDLLNEQHETIQQLKEKITHYDEVWVNELKKELDNINSKLRFIQPFIQSPVMTRITAPYHQERRLLLQRKDEIMQILEDLE